MKKVLLVSNKVMHYRVSVYNNFAERFRKCGWQLYVRTCELQKENPHEIHFDFAEIPFIFSEYRREIARIKPDVVITFLHLKDLIIWPLVHWLRLVRLPVVYWNKGINLEVRNPYVRNQAFYYIHSICNAIILYSAKEIVHIKPKNRHKVFVANNAINYEDFPSIGTAKDELKKELGIPFKKIVLFVGRMRDVKKVDHLIEVFRGLEGDCGLVIVGDGMSSEAKSRMNGLNTIYLGGIYDPKNEKIAKIFKIADLFCIPGDVGLGLNQAFYFGLPVVTEAGLQPPEINYLVDGRNGYMVPENDIATLKEKLVFLMDNDDVRCEYGRNARNDILKNASMEVMFKGFRDCLEFLSDGPHAGRSVL